MLDQRLAERLAELEHDDHDNDRAGFRPSPELGPSSSGPAGTLDDFPELPAGLRSHGNLNG